jgi:hypothetical protein
MNEIRASLKCDKSYARRLAAVEVGKTYSPPLTADEFESMLARGLGKFYGEKRNAAIRAAYAEKAKKKIPAVEAKATSTFSDLYRTWCAENNHVAGDVELAHFAGKTPAAAAYARNELAKSGYVFSKNGTGYNVVSVPEKPKYTEAQWREQQAKITQIEKLLSELKK